MTPLGFMEVCIGAALLFWIFACVWNSIALAVNTHKLQQEAKALEARGFRPVRAMPASPTSSTDLYFIFLAFSLAVGISLLLFPSKDGQ